MFLESFFDDGVHDIRVSPQQAGRFAKEIAGDFNPIHDPDNRRFCVPGDLLFALVLVKYGLSPHMSFAFSSMLGAGVALRMPPTSAGEFTVLDASGKAYLEVTRTGGSTHDEVLIENLIRRYVAFSGHNFPHILVPLMEQHQVMINPERPLVVYESMSFDLERLDITELSLQLADSTLEVKGKRGDVRLFFQFTSGDDVIGNGFKKLVLSGLRDYDRSALQGLVDRYGRWRAAYRPE